VYILYIVSCVLYDVVYCILVWTCRFKSTELRETEVLQAGLSTDWIRLFVEVIRRLAGPGLGGRVDSNRQSFVRLKLRKPVYPLTASGLCENCLRRRSMHPSLSCKVDRVMHVFWHLVVYFSSFGVDFLWPEAPLGSFWFLRAPRPIQDLILALFFPRSAKATKMVPKVFPKGSKGDSKCRFFKFAKHWFFAIVSWKSEFLVSGKKSRGRPKQCRNPGKWLRKGFDRVGSLLGRRGPRRLLRLRRGLAGAAGRSAGAGQGRWRSWPDLEVPRR